MTPARPESPPVAATEHVGCELRQAVGPAVDGQRRHGAVDPDRVGAPVGGVAGDVDDAARERVHALGGDRHVARGLGRAAVERELDRRTPETVASMPVIVRCVVGVAPRRGRAAPSCSSGGVVDLDGLRTPRRGVAGLVDDARLEGLRALGGRRPRSEPVWAVPPLTRHSPWSTPDAASVPVSGSESDGVCQAVGAAALVLTGLTVSALYCDLPVRALAGDVVDAVADRVVAVGGERDAAPWRR